MTFNILFNKWQDLANEVEFIQVVPRDYEISPLLTTEQLEIYQNKAKVILPPDYKAFCQLFGTGEFPYSKTYIRCPNIESLHTGMNSERIVISHLYSRLKAELKQSEKLEKGKTIKQFRLLKIQNLLESAYLVGYIWTYFTIIFDLSSYDELDQNYDIFALHPTDGCYFFGRDFYNFVNQFCMKTPVQKMFPELWSLLATTKDAAKIDTRQNVFLQREPET